MSGINPAQFQDILQRATDEQLMQMLKRPDKIPSMFIQQEIARRRQMRQAAQADMSKTGTLMMPARQPEKAYRQPAQVTPQPSLMHDGGRPDHRHIDQNAPESKYAGIARDVDVYDNEGKLISKGTGMPYAGAITRDYTRFASPYHPRYSSQAYSIADLGDINIPKADYGTVQKTGSGRKNLGLGIQELSDSGLQEGQGGNVLGTTRAMNDTPLPKDYTIVQGANKEGKGIKKPLTRSGIEGFYQGPIPKGKNPFTAVENIEDAEETTKKPDNIFDMTMGELSSLSGEINVDASLPDTSVLENQISQVGELYEEALGASKKAIDDSDTRLKKGITETESVYDEYINSLKASQKANAKLFDTTQMKALHEKSNAHWEKAIEFMKNDNI